MTPVSRDWQPLPEDPLQRALVQRLRAIEDGGVTDIARRLAALRGISIEGDVGQRRLKVLRRMVSRWRRGDKPDVPLSTVSEIAEALGESPLRLLSFGSQELTRAADAARRAAKKNDR